MVSAVFLKKNILNDENVLGFIWGLLAPELGGRGTRNPKTPKVNIKYIFYSFRIEN